MRRRISPGFSGTDPLDPFKILDLAAAGARFICTQYSIVLHACAVAAGWVARLVHVDSDHGPDEPSTSHGVVEVWVNELRKWVVLDAMYDVHYEKKGVLLNVHEMAQEWIRNAGRNVEVRIGMPRRKVRHSGKGVLHRRHESSAYFWAKHLWTWDPFTSFGTSPVDCQLCLIGPEHDGRMWYQGKPPQTYPLHAIKRGALQFTRRHADIYPDMNTVRLALGVASGKPAVSVRVETCTPGFDALLIQLDGGDWRPADLRFDWYPHPGVNSLSVRTRNQFGMFGAPSTVTAVLKRGRKTP